MNRRTFLLGTLAAMTLPAFAAGAQTQQDEADGLRLVLATDLHYIAPTLTDNGPYFSRMVENADGKVMTHIEPLTEAFVSEMIRLKPDALILSGDLTFNGAKESHEALAVHLSRIREAGVPVYVLPGNHDLNMRVSARFEGEGYTLVESITADEFAAIYRDFGFDAALARDPHSLSYAAALTPSLCLLMVDVNTAAAPGRLTQETLDFVRAQLEDARAAGARVIAVSHQNLLQHNPLFADGFVIENASPLARLYEEYGVLLQLSGHMHLQHTASAGAGLTEIAVSALSVSPNQYGLLTVKDRSLAFHTVRTDVESWAQRTGVSDPDLLRFEAFSDAFFRLSTVRQAQALFGDDERGKALSDYLSEVNACYFSGRMDLAPIDKALLEAWMAQGAFFSLYLRSIFSEPLIDHTQYETAW